MLKVLFSCFLAIVMIVIIPSRYDDLLGTLFFILELIILAIGLSYFIRYKRNKTTSESHKKLDSDSEN